MTSAAFQRELIEKIQALGLRRASVRCRRPMRGAAQSIRRLRRLGGSVQRTVKWRAAPPKPSWTEFKLRPFSAMPPRVLLIGASTGGPQALTKLVSRLDAVTESAPILITQHMPPTFTTILAEHLTRAGAKPVREAVDGEPVLAGHIYLAPGGRHMKVARRDGTAVIVLDDGAAGALLQARGRSAVCVRRRGLGLLESGADPDRHGHRRHRGRGRRRQRPAAASSRRTKPPAWSGACRLGGRGRRVLGGAAARADRAEGLAAVPGRAAHDAAGLRISAQAAEDALRPRAVGREALPRREPAAAGRAPARAVQSHRPRRQAPRRRTPSRSSSKWSRR